MKKMIAFTVAATMALSSLGVTAYASVFTDIKSVPWPGAATFIDQAQSLGLMSGYDEGGKKYAKPKNNVTYCETVQMVYSILKVQKNEDVTAAQVTKWSSVLSAYNIPSWANNAVVFALENNLIGNTDLAKFKNGTGPATREDVGVIFGKALGMFYKVNNSAKLTYKDAGNIGSASVPYLALLNEKKIMVGDDQNKFNPKAKINRAEMAVLSVKTYTDMGGGTGATAPSAGTVTGTVLNSMVLTNGDLFLSVKTSTGAGLNLFGKKNDVKVTYQKETVEAADIGTGDTVAITYSGETLKTVDITKSVDGIHTKKTLPIVSLSTSKITLKDGSKNVEYRIAKDVTVTLAGKKSSLSSLDDAMEDDEYSATVSFDNSGDVIKIEAVKNANNPLSGDLDYLSYSKVILKVGAKEYEYPLSSDDVTVKYDSKNMLFSKLVDTFEKNNYQVTLKLNTKGEVTAITVDFMEDETNGTIRFLNSRRIELLANGKTYEYDVDSDTDVTIDGKSKDLDDLVDTYKDVAYIVSLDVNSSDYVKEITAKRKNAELTEGKLYELSSSKIKIKVDGKTYEYSLNDPEIKIDGKSTTLSAWRRDYKDYEYTVTLTLDKNNKVTEISGKNEKANKGELSILDSGRDTMTIKAGGVSYKHTLASSVTVRLNGSSSSLTKLENALDDAKHYDETITVELSFNSSKEVTKITAESLEDAEDSKKGELRSVGAWDITIKESSGSERYNFGSGEIPITLNGSSSNTDKLSDALSELDTDEEYIQATLYFNSRDEVIKVTATVKDWSDEDEDEDDRIKEGVLYSIEVSDNEIKIKDGSDRATWKTTDSVRVTFSGLSNDYERDEYDTDLESLDDFFDDCDYYGDDCYVELTTNSKGNVTTIKATID